MALKRITQETFDAVVKENQDDFDMGVEDALADAIQQFESQGVDLSNIITTSGGGEGPSSHKVIEALLILSDLASRIGSLTDDDKQDLVETLNIFQRECDGDLARRTLAAAKGGYQTFMGLIKGCMLDVSDLSLLLDCFGSFINGQPDLLTDEGLTLLCDLVSQNISNESNILVYSVRAIRLCCVKHEMNRQNFVKKDIIPILLQALKENMEERVVIVEICSALRGFTVDDDIRVPYGKAHDHAKLIVENGALEALLQELKGGQNDQTITSEVCLTLGRLAVRDEFCKKIVDLGGLEHVLQTLSSSIGSQSVVKQVLVMLKAIAGNDSVKISIATGGGVILILNAMQKYIQTPQICEVGCGTVAVVTLRQPGNAKIVMEAGAAEAIVQAMNIHKGETGVQKQACHAIRNLVSRTPENCKPFLDLGAEALIQEALPLCKDEAKAALRDLGCKVELKELWTGVKNPISIT